MTDSEDTWPLPSYNPGARLHLHALGVIAIQFASFERGVDALYTTKARKHELPPDLSNLFYFSLNEEKRIEAIRAIFRAYEKDKVVLGLIENLLDYFQWCRNCRNQILHAERYPPMFGGDADTLYLSKRVGKQSPQSGYMKFKLPRLRFIADKIREGVVRSAEMQLRLRFRGRPGPEELPAHMQHFARDPWPGKLHVPRYLKLKTTP